MKENIKKNLPLRYRLILQKPFFIKTKITTERKKERKKLEKILFTRDRK
jgi:hypothetical protein